MSHDDKPLTYQPFSAVPELDELRQKLHINVPDHERIISVVAGVATLLEGLRERSLAGGVLALFGAALIARGSTGHCHLYAALGHKPTARDPKPTSPAN